MARRPVLLYVTGHPPAPIAAAHGLFRDWFEALWRDQPVDVTVYDVASLEPPPSPREFAGVVITGSPASVTEPEHWMEIAVEHIREAAHIGTPVLGVCFGHQLIGAAYGGSVIRNPRGWEVSTQRVELTDTGRGDPLFHGLDHAFEVNFSHADVIDRDTLSPANGIRVLARNDKAAVQALAAGDAIRGVQFHPEFSGEVSRAYIRTRRDDLAADAEARGAEHDHPERLLDRARDSEAGAKVFENFTRSWILQA